jgi:enoyl-CoA hydratase/carnithine racemase
LERLASPYALETFSVLTGEPVLVVDLDSDGPEPSAAALAAARATLAQLACPSVALSAGPPSPGASELLERFDLVVGSEAELTPVLDAARRTPLAALALVQLLRHSAGLDVHEGLIAESLVYSTLQSGPEFRRWLARRPASTSRAARPEPAVLARRSGARLELTLNRPEKRNAFSAEMRDALVEGLRIATSDPSIREVVLAGAGAAFCSGGDLDEFGTLPDPATAHGIRSTRNAARLLVACADRVRCEVHGACVGAGIELPAFSARIVAAEGAFFQLPEVGMGLVPGAGGTVSIPRRIGRQRTAYLALSGARLDVATARSWGLVDEVAA